MQPSRKRLAVAVSAGALAGLFCYFAGLHFVGFAPSLTAFVWILLNRTMIGFVIGVSSLRIHWIPHGLLMGFVVGSIFTFYVFMQGARFPLVVATVVLNLFFGFMIEFLASVVFKSSRIASAA
jgi:hypothetical protein